MKTGYSLVTTTLPLSPKEYSALPASAGFAPASAGAPFWLPVLSLTQRELVRFFRQRSRVIGALGQPFIFWILFGAGLSGSFQGPGGATYQEYFFAGVAVMIVLFTAIFSTISIIEDRREGFLQGVLVSPVPRLAIVCGKVFGGTVLAVLQTLLFLAIGPLLAMVGLSPAIDIGLTPSNIIPVIAWLIVLGVTLTALGFVIAWRMESTQGFHAIMSVFLMPMWLLSGSIFPATGSGWLSVVMRLNPLTYGVAGLRRLLAVTPESVASLPSWPVCGAVTGLFCGVCLAVAVGLVKQPAVHNAR